MSSLKSKHIWILVILVMAVIIPVIAQTTAPGSNIVSRTLLSSDGTMKLVQRVYDNGLGDAVQEIQSYTGSSLPSVIVHHEYDDYRRRTKTWLPVTSSDSFTFRYYNKDHLGNNREVVNGSGTVQQVTRSTSGRLLPKGRKNYYPSGAPYAEPVAVVNASFQPYKYNGKELDLMEAASFL